jgi:hypothetical protein
MDGRLSPQRRERAIGGAVRAYLGIRSKPLKTANGAAEAAVNGLTWMPKCVGR